MDQLLAEGHLMMQRALELAKRGLGLVAPNPMVGALIVKNHQILGEGYHQVFGGCHAEVNAIKQVKERHGQDACKGSTLYVTLEPCSHYGKTPPCVLAIIESGIKTVVVGCADPNPLVSNKGIRTLKEAGVEVLVGVLETECLNLIEAYAFFHRAKRPFVRVKAAASLDGKIQSVNRESQWITGKASRLEGHLLRAKSQAILVGVNTIIKDNPLLTARYEGISSNPIRIVVDSHLRTPLHAQVVQTAREVKTIIFTTSKASERAFEALQKAQVEVIRVNEKAGQVDLWEVMRVLGSMQIQSLLVEGGGSLIGSLSDERLINEINLFLAPIIIGGKETITWVEGKGATTLKEALRCDSWEFNPSGEDLHITGKVSQECLQD